MMFYSFTASADRALKRADRLARRRGAASVEPLDLLAALAIEAECRAAELLVEFRVDTERLWTELGPAALGIVTESLESELEIEATSGGALAEPLAASPALRLVLSEATLQARALHRKREVGTEHLLAGLLSSPGPAAELLQAAGLELPALRHRLIPNFEAEAEGITTDHIVAQILRDVPRDTQAIAI